MQFFWFSPADYKMAVTFLGTISIFKRRGKWWRVLSLENIKMCRSPTAHFPLISLGTLGHRARTSFEGGRRNEEQRSFRNGIRNYPTSEALKTNSILEIGFSFLPEEMGN